MKLISIQHDQWEQYRRPLLRFVKRHEKETDTTAYSWLFRLKKHHFHKPGTCIKIALWEGKIIAVAAVTDYGTTHSTLLLAPHFPNKQIQIQLLSSLIDELGVCYRKVRYDDKEQIKLALQAGFVCFAYLKETDHRMYLWFGGGHWNTNDVIEKEA